MSNKKYAAIRTMDELNAAITLNKRQLGRKERLMSKQFGQVKQTYNPSALLKTGVRGAVISLIGPEFLLRTVRRARKLLK